MNGFGITKTTTVNVTPSTIVYFDQLTPTTGGVVFDPNTPATTDVLYVSSVDASTWIWDGSAYVTYTAPTTSSTEWYLYGTTIDAGSNKTASISRIGAIYTSADSYFGLVRFGHGNGTGGGEFPTNTLAGRSSLTSNTTGGYNTALGFNILPSNTTGSANTGVGSRALYTNTIGQQNVAIGDTSMYFNTTGTNNVAVGINSLYRNTTGGNNTALGYQAGSFLADGTTNNTAPDSSVFIGSISRAKTINDVNQIVIGYNAIGKGSNTTVIGNTSTTDTYLQGAVTVNNAYKLPSVDGTANYFLKTNGLGVVSWAVAGLSYFTEAQNTASPNATVYANSLTAVSSTTNADFAILPKGSGAILANIPDNTTTGGNKRGLYVLDLQRSRSNSTYVALGDYSVILGGSNNSTGVGATASMVGGVASGVIGARSFAYGSSCISSGYCSIAFSENSTASGDNAFSHGLYATASGYASISIGRNAVSSNTYAMALGAFTIADGNSSVAINNNAHTFGMTGRIVFSSTGIGTRGDAQSSKAIFRKITTDATPTVLSTDNGSAISANQLTLSSNNTIRVKGTIVGRKTGSTDTSVWDVDCVIQRGTTAGSTTIVGAANVNVVTNIPAWGTPTLTANTTLGCLTITVTGLLATNIQWVCSIDTTEVIYA